MRTIFITLLAVGALWVEQSQCDVLETMAQWPLIDYALPYDSVYLDKFQPENVVATGIEIAWHRIFVATPRLRAGVPATLSYIPRDLPPGSSPQLQAYPSWDWHWAGREEYNCSTLISVYRVRADRCNRLWVLDSGVTTSLDDFRPVCPPKLLVFDLQTDEVVRHIIFPREVLRPNTLLTNIVIDDTAATTCDDVFVYMTDTTGPGILVFDGARDRSWRVLHASMLPNPDEATYKIGSDTFELFDGVVGLAFSPKLGRVYFQPLATNRLYSVPTSALQAGPTPFGEQLPVTLVGRKSSQGVALSVDPRDDTIIFSPLTETAVAAWQPQIGVQKILSHSAEKLQFVAEIRWAERDNGNIWVLSSRFQKFFKKTVNPQEINIRIMRIRPENPMSKSPLLRRYETPQAYYNHTALF